MFWPASFGSFGKSKLENFRPLPLIKLPGGRSIDRAAARTSSGAIDLAFGSTSVNNVHSDRPASIGPPSSFALGSSNAVLPRLATFSQDIMVVFSSDKLIKVIAVQ